jgi:hypothetical protein
MKTGVSSLSNWEEILQMLPSARDQKARELGAFQRPREIKSSDDLLRLLMLYAWADCSLMNTAAAASQAEIAFLSDVALLKRFRHMSAWLLWLVETLLQQRVPPPVPIRLPYRIQIADASVLTIPGSKGTDYRLHAQYNLLTQQLQHVEITDAKGGESLTRYPASQGDLFIADRGYGHRKDIAYLDATGAKILVRFAWCHLPLEKPDGTGWDLLSHLVTLKDGQIGDWQVQTVADTSNGFPPVAGRLVAIPKTPEQTEEAIDRAKKTAAKKGHQVSPETLIACGYFFVFTTLAQEEADGSLVLALYRFRWQIEMAFKLLKSQLHLDHIRAHQPEMVRTYLLCKLLGALLLEDLTSCFVSFSPTGP